MKIRKQPALIALAGGFLGFMLRALLYRIGFDEKGILSDTHILHLACVLLTGIMAVYLALRPAKIPAMGPGVRFLLGLPAGYFLLIHGLILFRQATDPLSMVRFVLTLAAGIAMVVSVFPVDKPVEITAACHGLVGVSYALDMLCRYRVWSGNPQLPDYCFHVLCGVALSLCAYQTLALHTGLAKPRVHSYWCLSALYLSVLCLVGPEPWEFYLSGAFWAAACLLCPVPPAENPAPEEEPDVFA